VHACSCRCVETSGEGSGCPSEGGLFVGGITIQALPPLDAGTRSDAENFGAETVASKRRAWESNELPRMGALPPSLPPCLHPFGSSCGCAVAHAHPMECTLLHGAVLCCAAASLMAVGQNGPEEYLRAVAASHMDRAGLRFGSSRSQSLGGMAGTSAAIQHVTDMQVRPLDFHCRCSKEGFVSRLSVLDVGELESMRREGGTELSCNFCAEKYPVSADDLGALISHIQQQGQP
jgi:hypothetical protein